MEHSGRMSTLTYGCGREDRSIEASPGPGNVSSLSSRTFSIYEDGDPVRRFTGPSPSSGARTARP